MIISFIYIYIYLSQLIIYRNSFSYIYIERERELMAVEGQKGEKCGTSKFNSRLGARFINELKVRHREGIAYFSYKVFFFNIYFLYYYFKIGSILGHKPQGPLP